MRVEKRPTVWGLRVKQARERLGLSQKSLGIEAGLDEFVASTRINRYETGIHKPDEAFSRKIAEILRVPDACLHAESDDLALLIEIWGALPDARRKRLESFAIDLAQEAGGDDSPL